MEKSYVIGIDMGGTNTEFGIVDRKGDILFRGSISTLGNTKGDYIKGENYVGDLGNAINDLIIKNNLKDKVKGIGMGVPNGNMNDGTVANAANIPWTKGVVVHLAKLLSEKTGLPCRLTNDANAAAMGEMAYGAAKGMKDFIEITLGTGVGSGIVSNGQLVVGHDGFAGELGHVKIVRDNGRPCGCGLTGCLETYTSATGVARTARELLEMQPERESVLRNIQHRPITSKDVYEAAKAGDKLAIEVFNFTGRILGETFCNFIAFSSPKAIILFGGLAHSGNFLLEPLKKAMNENICFVYKGKTDVIISQLNDAEAAILGASALAWE
jgi:glucokinase